ncbi:hypothetical protein [Flavobacterium sp.]|uniref:hypothetical protein n=1 Tax=Flavobacterium sp. TaxID=239 RepID=UPI0038FC41C5
MIKELLISFKENLESKTSNPFFGTVILIWIIKNWNLIYSIFNFESKTTLELKRQFIIKHFKFHPLIETLLYCVAEAFVILITSYLLINISRLIINFFEKKVTPLVYKWTDKNSIVLKTVYDTLETERIRLEKRVDEERDARLKLQEDYDKLEKRYSDFLVDAKLPKTSNLSSSKNDSKDEIDSESQRVKIIKERLTKDNKIDKFEIIAASVLNNESMQKDNAILKEFTVLGLITRGSSGYPSGNFYYNLTSVGKSLHEMLLMEKLR